MSQSPHQPPRLVLPRLMNRLALVFGACALAGCGGDDTAGSGSFKPADIADPLFRYQWHLVNTGQIGDPRSGLRGVPGVDINVAPTWARGLDGRGVTVAVVDDGLELAHEDLRANIAPGLSYNYATNSGNPTPPDKETSHGTSVAGVIAAARNGLGGVGVAPSVSLAGLALLNVDPEKLSSASINALLSGAANGSIAISNNSWGPIQYGMPSGSMTFEERAMREGTDQGRQGKGIVYVFAAGNDNYLFTENRTFGPLFNSSNFDPILTLETLPVCAVNARGVASSYSSTGSNLLTCAPSNNIPIQDAATPGITTTEPFNAYTHEFGGTSSAAPTVSGIVALMLQANSQLTWRDVRLILARTSRVLPSMRDDPSAHWTTTAATNPYTGKRYRYSPRYGFGLVDADAATRYAKRFASVGGSSRAWRTQACQGENAVSGKATPASLTRNIAMNCGNRRVEFLNVSIELEHASFRALSVTLISPGGTPIHLSPASDSCNAVFGASPRCSTAAFNNRYVTNAITALDEPASGNWTLRIDDALGSGQPLAFKKVELKIL